ncbi:MAG TPA: phosphoribulokinase [Ktedonobacteraceae bacterium]|nr:phosphoribulokinase [Ktedonobacteraceae bacterium]
MQRMTTALQPLIVAICGDSGSGKTTLTDGMVRVFGQDRITHICLDDYHILDRATRLQQSITALRPEANNLPLMTEHIRRLARGESVVKPVYDHKTGTFAAPERACPSEIIIVHGLHPLFTEELRSLAHVRIYLDPETALLQQWKIMRDSTSRGYTVEQVRQQMKIRRRDSRLFIQPQKQFADIIIRFSRGDLYYRTRDLAHLDVRLIEAKHAPKIDLTDVLEMSHNGSQPALRLTEAIYQGSMRDVLEIDGTITHQKARELEDRIWSHMQEASHLRPDRLQDLGRFYTGNIQRQSDTLALTQLIVLYHVISARQRMERNESGSTAQQEVFDQYPGPKISPCETDIPNTSTAARPK